jgi:hypothetical protein
MRQLLNWGSWILSLPVMAFSATPYLAGAWRALRTRTIGMDVPVALGVVITFVASTGATFDPGGVFGHEVYFDSLTMFVTFLLGARWLELRARQGAAASLERAMARLPEDQRVALVMVAVKGMSYEEVAKVTGCAVGTAKCRVFRARRALEARLLDEPAAERPRAASRLPADRLSAGVRRSAARSMSAAGDGRLAAATGSDGPA